MKRKHLFTSLLLFAVAFTLMLTGCKKDPEPLALESLMAGTIDLNGATSPSNVPVNPTIVATFNVDVDPATATASTITMVQDYDDAPVALTINASGNTITITPTANLGTGALYQLSFGAGLKSVDALAITPLQRTFTTAGTFAPAGAVAHFTFEDNANDIIGAWDPVAADIIYITYTASRNAAAGKAATFNGTTSLIEIPNGDLLMNTNSFTIAFWVKTNSTGKTNGHFVMGLAGWNGIQYEIYGGYDGSKFAIQYQHATGTASEDMWFPVEAKYNNLPPDQAWQGWTYAKSLTAAEMMAKLKDNWLNVVYTYNAPTKVGTLYFDGVKMKSFDFNLWPDTDAKKGVTGLKYAGIAADKKWALGFIQGRNNRTISDDWANYADPANQHFKGQLDDIRIWHKALTENEITLMYNSEKP